MLLPRTRQPTTGSAEQRPRRRVLALGRSIVLGCAAVLVALGFAATSPQGPGSRRDGRPLSSSGVGQLTVVSSPAVPTQVLIDGNIADSWGVTGVTLPSGTHTVSFTHVPGYIDPAPQTITVANGASVTVTGSFVPTGWLRVMTSPAVAAQITVDGT